MFYRITRQKQSKTEEMDEDESNGYVDISNDNSDVMWMKMALMLPRNQTSLSLDENVRAKEGGKETTGQTRFACRLYPSHGPLRFITSHLRFAHASTMRKTKSLRRRLALMAARRAEVTKYAQGKPSFRFGYGLFSVAPCGDCNQ